MKKLFTLLLVFSLATSMEARLWNFSSWSDATWEALRASAAKSMADGWSDVEKTSGTAPTEQSKDNCFWQASIDTDDDGNEHLWLIGLNTDDVNNYGYAEYLKNADGLWIGGYSARVNILPDGTSEAKWLQLSKEEFQIPW